MTKFEKKPGKKPGQKAAQKKTDQPGIALHVVPPASVPPVGESQELTVVLDEEVAAPLPELKKSTKISLKRGLQAEPPTDEVLTLGGLRYEWQADRRAYVHATVSVFLIEPKGDSSKSWDGKAPLRFSQWRQRICDVMTEDEDMPLLLQVAQQLRDVLGEDLQVYPYEFADLSAAESDETPCWPFLKTAFEVAKAARAAAVPAVVESSEIAAVDSPPIPLPAADVPAPSAGQEPDPYVVAYLKARAQTPAELLAWARQAGVLLPVSVPVGGRRYGIIDHLATLTQAPQGVTIQEALEGLKLRFPERDAGSMRSTVRAQLSGKAERLGKDRKLQIEITEEPGRGRVVRGVPLAQEGTTP